jgi:formate hydrogenlyase subunit 4
MAKLFVYAALLVDLFFPWGGGWVFPANVAALLAKVLALVLLVTFLGATHARYRIDQAIRAYAGLFGLSLVALVLAVLGL